MNTLSKIFAVKIVATSLVWCVPLIFMPASWLENAGFPRQNDYMFVSLLGWAYLTLCVGYGFGLRAALKGKRAIVTIWVGIFSNGSACACLSYYAATGKWASWSTILQCIGWGSIIFTLLISLALFFFGVKGQGEIT